MRQQLSAIAQSFDGGERMSFERTAWGLKRSKHANYLRWARSACVMNACWEFDMALASRSLPRWDVGLCI